MKCNFSYHVKSLFLIIGFTESRLCCYNILDQGNFNSFNKPLKSNLGKKKICMTT